MSADHANLSARDMEQVVCSLADTIDALAHALPETPAHAHLHERARQATEVAQTTIALLLNPESP